MKIIALLPVVVAVTVLIDFATVKYRPVVYDRFYRWWLRLSEMNLHTAGERGVRRLNIAIDRVFGAQVFSRRSILGGMFFVMGATLAVTSFPKPAGVANMVTAVLVSAAVLIPAVITFQSTRLLLHVLNRRFNFIRVVMFGLASVVLIETTVILSYASLGLLTAFLVRLAFNHHLALADVVPVTSLLLLIALGLVLGYLPVAIFPATCCVFIWTAFILFYLSSKLGVLVRDFLEIEWETPFTYIGAVLAAVVTLILLLSDCVNPRDVMTFVLNKQTLLDTTSAYRATAVGTRISIVLSADKPNLAKYYVEWAGGLRQFMTKGIPTPEEAKAILEVHLPSLARQWHQQQRQ